jgi:gliding motility-associated-like protein
MGNYSFDIDGSSLAGIQQYTLQPGNVVNNTGIFNQLYAGQFTVTVTDNYSCTNSTVVTLPSPDIIDLTTVTVNDDSCYFNLKNQVKGIVNGGVDPKIFYVIPGGMTNNTGIFSNMDPDQYYMVVTDSMGCSDTAPFEVTDHQCCTQPFVASAFSPNHDGLNDELHCIHFYGLTIEKFIIVNRYGNVVFKAQNDQDSWDGTYHGTPCDVGTYFYLVRYKCEETKEEGILKGDVSLIR